MSKIKVATKFSEKLNHSLPEEITKDEYLNAFADKMMHLSNRLNEVNHAWDDAADIRDDYMPAIQEFILNINGL